MRTAPRAARRCSAARAADLHPSARRPRPAQQRVGAFVVRQAGSGAPPAVAHRSASAGVGLGQPHQACGRRSRCRPWGCSRTDRPRCTTARRCPGAPTGCPRARTRAGTAPAVSMPPCALAGVLEVGDEGVQARRAAPPAAASATSPRRRRPRRRATVSRKASSLAIRPPVRMPSAITCAPVSVAMSTIASGCFSPARTIPSAMTIRPSASVLMISTVLPPRIVTTSPGRCASELGMFSARQR